MLRKILRLILSYDKIIVSGNKIIWVQIIPRGEHGTKSFFRFCI